MRTIIGVVMVGAALFAAMPAVACSRRPGRGVAAAGFVLPADGAHVPSNVRIWLADVSDSGDAGVPVLQDSTGHEVAVTHQAIVVAGEAPTSLHVVTPSAPLPHGEYSFATDAGVRHFVVDADADTTAPSAPTATATANGGASSAGLACGAPTLVSVTLDSEPQVLALMVSTSAAAATLPTTALAASVDTHLDAISLPQGKVDFALINVDLAGNVSAATSLSVDVPPQAGCAAAGNSALALFAMLVWVALRRRVH